MTIIQGPSDPVFGPPVTIGLGLNNLGDVVGHYYQLGPDSSEAFVFSSGSGMFTLPRPVGISSSQANEINDAGLIVGTYVVTDVGFRGYVYENGEYAELPPLPGGVWSQALAVNNAGTVVGYRSIGNGVNPFNAFIWSQSEGFIDLGVMEGPNSSAEAVSDVGLVVGWTGGNFLNSSAFLWEAGGITELGLILGGDTSYATGVNNKAVVCGFGLVPHKGFTFGVSRAFLWDNGKYTLLGTLPNHMLSAALDVNDGKQVVGSSWYVDGNPNISHAYIWQNGIMTDLNELIPPDVSINIKVASAINNAGQITGRASTPGGSVVAVLLTPINQPPGDLDHDCTVGRNDLNMLLAAWGPCPPSGGCLGDVDGDGNVGVLDLLVLLANWSF